MAFSLLAYFFSMVTTFAAIMAVLIGFGDSQLRTTSLLHHPLMSMAETIPAPSRAKVAEPKIAEQEKPNEAKKIAQAREDPKKIARAKLARERKRVVVARLRQQRENALALGYADQPFNSPTFSPFGQRTEY
jgi:ABC-type siderophore export system fused ATPase/permease subunit